MPVEDAVRAFERLGLTKVEAEVYVYLVQHSPATGYGIAKAINRTKGATYKVLASLESKGAIMADNGDRRLYRPIPPEELLQQMEDRFFDHRRDAGEAVKHLPDLPTDDRIYRLTTVDQVYERARRMLASCDTLAIVELFPGPAQKLRDDILAAVARGARIAVDVHEPVDIPGAKVVVEYRGYDITRRISAQFMAVFVDGKEALIAFLSKEEDRVLQAIWSANPLLSWAAASYAKMAVLGYHLQVLIEDGAPVEEISGTCRGFFEYMPPYMSSGWAELRRRLGLKEVEPQ